MDWSGAYYCALTMLCAIYYKKRTGKGQYIDCSQVEPGIYMTGTAILDYLVNGRHYRRTGNRCSTRRRNTASRCGVGSFNHCWNACVTEGDRR